MDDANASVVGAEALRSLQMTRTIWTLGDAVRRFPLMRVDCPCGNVGFFNTQDIISEVGFERDPHKVPFKCRECGGVKRCPGRSSCSKWTLIGLPRWASGSL